MKRAALYCRVSTEEQARHGYSIGAQLDALRKYAKQHNYAVAGEYIDDGISGQKGYKKRPAMSELMQALDNIDVILFIRLDRWFRSVKLYYEAQALLDAHGVAWAAIQEDYETVTSAGRFKVNIMLSVAQNEAEKTSERINFVFEAKRQRGEVCSGSVPLGYQIVDKHMIPEEGSAAIVQDMFRRYIELRSVFGLRDYMLEKYGIVKSYAPLKRILQNRKYIGGEHHAGIIDPETFRQAQEILASRSIRHHPTGIVYLFGGMIYCRKCGRRMKCGRPDNRNYYYCANHSDYGDVKCTCKKHHYEADIESFLLDHLKEAAESFNASLAEAAKPLKDPEKIRRKMEKLKDLYLEDLIDKEIYQRDFRVLEQDLADSSYVPTAKPVDLDGIDQALDLYATLSKDSQKAFWSRVLKRIEISEDAQIFLIIK